MVFPKEKQPTVSCFSGYRVYVDGLVKLKTTAGELTIRLRPEMAPNNAWNFRHLAESGFYNGTDFHRVVPVGRIAGKGFVVQGGDPTSTGEGTPGYDIRFEPSALKHDFGVVSMARDAEADTAGAQFFICLSREETARLDGLYCAFAQIVEGESVRTLRAIESGKLLPGGDRPEKPVKIERAWVEDAPPRDKQPAEARLGGADGGR
ncbi:MAG: peptidylprolyl isomerase [Phycisphaerales bacterium]|nr:peptidylprolyl isomerase [Phycisphaerales bacterium]